MHLNTTRIHLHWWINQNTSNRSNNVGRRKECSFTWTTIKTRNVKHIHILCKHTCSIQSDSLIACGNRLTTCEVIKLGIHYTFLTETIHDSENCVCVCICLWHASCVSIYVYACNVLMRPNLFVSEWTRTRNTVVDRNAIHRHHRIIGGTPPSN